MRRMQPFELAKNKTDMRSQCQVERIRGLQFMYLELGNHIFNVPAAAAAASFSFLFPPFNHDTLTSSR